ncbi:MAG: hypothetical protein EOO17_00810 [Chloroflexi bacterium]|nr:MAG: hypothetical protein EOO17_00810 [Chloroflexota bacterium]
MNSIKFGDKDYALVPARLKKFREANVRASVETEPSYNADGSITFKATITQDRANEYSAMATGTARYTEAELKKPKAFEKLETISVGRALANMGYLNDGQIATTEEMQEFEDYQLNKVEQALRDISKAEKRGDFESIISKLNAEQQLQIAPKVKERMREIANAAK